jgi:hypothetical protein
VHVTEVCAPAVKFPIAFPGIETFEHVLDKNVPVLNKYVRLTDEHLPQIVEEQASETTESLNAAILTQFTRYAQELKDMCNNGFGFGLLQVSQSDGGLQSRVLLDAFHFMRRLDLPKKHSSQGEFSKALRDAMFILDEYDKLNVTRYLATQNKTFEEKATSEWKWVSKRVRRYIPNSLELMHRFMKVVRTFAHQKDSESNLPLFNGKTFKCALSMLEHIAAGCLSDPPGEPLILFVRSLI